MLDKHDYGALSEFRSRLVHFFRFSQRTAAAAGVTSPQYLLLLHLRGFAQREWATVGELAGRLLASHQAAAALVQRCAAKGLVRKRRNARDARCVEIHLTAAGRRLVERVALHHGDELARLRDLLNAIAARRRVRARGGISHA